MYSLSVKSIKNLLRDELKRHKENVLNVLHNPSTAYTSDVQKEIICNGFDDAFRQLDVCTSYEDLDELISYLGYRMSLEDWVNSL